MMFPYLLLTTATLVYAVSQPDWHQWPSSAIHTTCQRDATPSYRFSSFTYPPTITGTPLPASSTASQTTTYALAYSQISSLFANQSTTTWDNWTPNHSGSATPSQTSLYDNAALSAVWNAANPTNFTRGLYSTTVSPTPISTQELIPPPPLYFTPQTPYEFPEDFVFGVASSASQCEGAIADDGKTPSFMDMVATIFSIVGSSISNSFTGAVDASNIANDYTTLEHYYLYKQDIDRLAALGLKHFAFSIQWTRILPFALPGTPVNAKAIQHYDDVINYILEKGMQPVVTLTHYDTPLQFYGGGSEYLLQLARAGAAETYGLGSIDFAYDNSTFVDAYENYAQIVMSHYADRVPVWITFNEPQIGTLNGVAVNNVLQAHARAYHFYKNELKGQGKVSIKMGIIPALPLDPSNASHVEAANFFTDLYVGAFLDPLASGLDEPAAYKNAVADAISISPTNAAFLNGTIDFVALDAYAAPVVVPAVSNLTECALNRNSTTNPHRAFPICVEVVTTNEAGWALGYSPFGSAVEYSEPFGLRPQLNYAWNRWRKPVMVTEFGLDIPVPPGGRLQDNLNNVPQSEYLLSYLDEMLKAIWEDGVHVMGALVWNFADDWEFTTFDDGFGLQFNNFTTQQRIYRRSAFDVVSFVEGRRGGCNESFHW